MPFKYKGTLTFYSPGEIFEVLELKTFPNVDGTFARIRSMKYKITLEGWNNLNSFKEKVI